MVMNDSVTLREVQKALESQEKLYDTRFDTICKSMDRVEQAIADHAKTSLELNERISTRAHERMDKIVSSITKVNDKLDDVQNVLNNRISVVESESHTRINKLIWGTLMAVMATSGWLVVKVFGIS